MLLPAPKLQQPRQQQTTTQVTLQPSANSHASPDFSDAFNYAEEHTFAVSPRMATHGNVANTVPIITIDVSESKSEQAREREEQERNYEPQHIQDIVQKPVVHGALRSAAPPPSPQGQAPTAGTPFALTPLDNASKEDMTRKYEMDDIKYSILSHASAMGVNPDKLSEYPTAVSGNNTTFLSMLLQETRLVASKERMAQEQERIDMQVMHEKISQSLLTFSNHQQAQINQLTQATARRMQKYKQQVISVSHQLQVLKSTKQVNNGVNRHVIMPSIQRSAALPPLSPSLSRPLAMPVSPIGAGDGGSSRSHWLNGTPEFTPHLSNASTPRNPSTGPGVAQKGVSVGLLLHANSKGDVVVAGLTPSGMAERSGKIQLGE